MGLKVFPVSNYLDFSWIMHFSKTHCLQIKEMEVRKDTIEKRSVKKNTLNINDRGGNGNTLKANVRAFKYVIKIDL